MRTRDATTIIEASVIPKTWLRNSGEVGDGEVVLDAVQSKNRRTVMRRGKSQFKRSQRKTDLSTNQTAILY